MAPLSENQPSYPIDRATLLRLRLGYAVAIAGFLAWQRVPLAVSILAIIGGLVLVSIKSPACYVPRTKRRKQVETIGGLLLLAAIVFYGDATVNLWRPHPLAIGFAWLVLTHAFAHDRCLRRLRDDQSEPATS